MLLGALQRHRTNIWAEIGYPVYLMLTEILVSKNDISLHNKMFVFRVNVLSNTFEYSNTFIYLHRSF